MIVRVQKKDDFFYDSIFQINNSPQFINELSNHNSLSDVIDCAARYTLEQGFLNFGYYHFPPIGHGKDFRLPAVWRGTEAIEKTELLKLCSQNLENLSEKARHLVKPSFFPQAIEALGLTETELTSLKRVHGRSTCNGIIIPVHGPSGRSGAILVGLPDEAYVSPEECIKLQSLLTVFHLRICDLLREDSLPFKLSRREVEILSWAAKGKSNSVIAQILDISPHTVNGYLRSILLKTRTTDRISAILLSVGYGIIQF